MEKQNNLSNHDFLFLLDRLRQGRPLSHEEWRRLIEGPDGEQDDEMGIEGFTTVSKDTKFYLNEEGNPVIVFDEYEIAPGYMGMPEFEIERG